MTGCAEMRYQWRVDALVSEPAHDTDQPYTKVSSAR
jgi:hypothetical protein